MTAEIKNVAQPIFIPLLNEIPCESTDHGAFPVCDWTNNASPNPKIVKPKIKMAKREVLRSHLLFAVQGVTGIVRCGLKAANNLAIQFSDLPALSNDIAAPYQQDIG